ncbi:MAG: hypothetical protein ACPGSO_05665 [Vicingaceae bacterium]
MDIKRIKREDFNQVLEISDTVLGENYITETYLNKFINSDHYLGYTLLKSDIVIGFTSLILLPVDEFKKAVLKEQNWFSKTVKGCKIIGLRKQTIIHPNYTGNGYGYQLFDYSVRDVESLCDVQISTVWKKENEQAMQRLLVKCGFNYAKTIPNYWREDSLDNNYSCGVCGLPPCKCATEVYIKKNAPE